MNQPWGYICPLPLEPPSHLPPTPPLFSQSTGFELPTTLWVLNHVQLFVTPWAAAHQAPLCMEFSRHKYWEWAAISYSRGSFQPRDETHVSRISHMGSQILYQRHHLGSPCFTYSKFPLATYFTHGDKYVSTLLFPFVPPSLSPVNPVLGEISWWPWEEKMEGFTIRTGRGDVDTSLR